jgi:hypothetical protein
MRVYFRVSWNEWIKGVGQYRHYYQLLLNIPLVGLFKVLVLDGCSLKY